MTRSRVVVLVAVLAIVALAFTQGFNRDRKAGKDALAPLRAQAGLDPCPTGVSPDLPRLTLACLGGGPAVALQGPPSGKPTLVNVYGSWCVPCQQEMPLLASFAKASEGKVSLLGVDTEDEPRLALTFAKDVGQTWNAVVDDDKAVLSKYASGPPVTLFVDPAGKIVHVKVGAFRDLAEVKALTAAYLRVAV